MKKKCIELLHKLKSA